jgi:hypothetical protein
MQDSSQSTRGEEGRVALRNIEATKEPSMSGHLLNGIVLLRRGAEGTIDERMASVAFETGKRRINNMRNSLEKLPSMSGHFCCNVIFVERGVECTVGEQMHGERASEQWRESVAFDTSDLVFNAISLEIVRS